MVSTSVCGPEYKSSILLPHTIWRVSQAGKAEDCNSLIVGSNPTHASIILIFDQIKNFCYNINTIEKIRLVNSKFLFIKELCNFNNYKFSKTIRFKKKMDYCVFKSRIGEVESSNINQ